MYYSHTQEIDGRWTAAASVAGGAALLALLPGGMLARVAWLGLAAVTAKTFRALTVNVDTTSVNFHFGDGLISKSIPLADIKAAKAIRTTPVQGWGIHWIGKGWLYNIYGLDAVDIELKGGKHVFLGTDQPQELTAVINQHKCAA
jgi:hypothetical protein